MVEILTDEEINQVVGGIDALKAGVPRPGRPYNIAPTTSIRAIRLDQDGRPELVSLHWGLIPHWEKTAKGLRPFNVKSETIDKSGMFREAFKRRRCLVPANGWYEWPARPDGVKQPTYIYLANGEPMVFAGIWESWHDGEPDAVESVTFATVAPSKEFARIHSREVVILHDQEDRDAWLDPDTSPPDAKTLLVPSPPGTLRFRPVGNWVSKRHDGPENLVEAVVAAEPKPLKFKRPARRPSDAEDSLF